MEELEVSKGETTKIGRRNMSPQSPHRLEKKNNRRFRVLKPPLYFSRSLPHTRYGLTLLNNGPDDRSSSDVVGIDQNPRLLEYLAKEKSRGNF